jgi:hypothetical protein
MRIPYSNPDNARTTVLCINFSNPTNAAGVVKIWDQDLTDLSVNTQAATTARTSPTGTGGSLASPVLQFNVPASGDVITEVMTRPYFQGGIACQSTINNLFYSIYVVHQGLG